MKKLILSAIALLFAFPVAAQQTDSQIPIEVEQNQAQRYGDQTQKQSPWGFGGAFGVSLGSRSFGFQLSPQLIYWLREDLTVGGGINYSYLNRRGTRRYTLNYFGINGSVHYYPIRNIFVFAQPEVWTRWGKIENIRTGQQVFMALPLGAGFMVPAGNDEMQVAFYYDVIQNNYSPHGNGIGISIGYIVRF